MSYGEIMAGTCSWQDHTNFYPPGILGRDRITYYSQHFRVVEIDSTFYHLPSVRNMQLWAQRTPEGFIFDVKAYGQMTWHDREHEPDAEVFEVFGRALEPLVEAGRLGVVLFQFPPWFRNTPGNQGFLEVLPELLPGRRLAVEFRHRSWLTPEVQEDTWVFLETHNLAFVCVDEPQVGGASVPPVAAVTCPEVALVRFHGRNKEGWLKRGATVAERFSYLYQPHELAEWVPKIHELAQKARQVHVLMNNCAHDFAVRNAKDLAAQLSLFKG